MVGKDLKQVCDIENDTFSEPWSYNSFSTSLSSKDNTYLVAEEDGEVLGYCGMWGSIDEGQITNVAVKKSHRGKKIGHRLVKTLIDYGKEDGFSAFTLEVRKGNTKAVNFYLKHGFEVVTTKAHYYEDGEDALYMTRKVDLF
jgi:ribosomal-protein-alanine N-acetyltransferase